MFTAEEAARAMAMLRTADEEEGEPVVRRLGRKLMAVREEALVPTPVAAAKRGRG